MAPSTLFVTLFVAYAILIAPVKAYEAWIEGRATFYDDNTQGSCRFEKAIPKMYAAWPDTLAGFEGSCGTCLEVACVNKDFTDRYGGLLERSSACYDEARTVVVKVVDSCPCVHANFASNQRWCCGDMNHLDLGRAAFASLAAERWGVVGLRWRRVSCDRLGAEMAYGGAPAAAPAAPDAPTPQPEGLAAPPSADQSSWLQQLMQPSGHSGVRAPWAAQAPEWQVLSARQQRARAAGGGRKRGAGAGVGIWSGGRVWGA